MFTVIGDFGGYKEPERYVNRRTLSQMGRSFYKHRRVLKDPDDALYENDLNVSDMDSEPELYERENDVDIEKHADKRQRAI